MPFSLLQKLCDTPLVFVDVETTGASADWGDRVIEIGLLRVEAGARVATLCVDADAPLNDYDRAADFHLTGVGANVGCVRPGPYLPALRLPRGISSIFVLVP